VVIEAVYPEIDGGRFPIKRCVGEPVEVEADVFADGHDLLQARLLYRPAGQMQWQRAEMQPVAEDRWRGRFIVEQLGWYEYTVEAWVDRFRSWQHELSKKHEAGMDVASELLEGAALVQEARRRTAGDDADWLAERAALLADTHRPAAERVAIALAPELARRVGAVSPRTGLYRYPLKLSVMVERERARYGAWYEMFPRSCSPEPGRHGTFQDLIRHLPYIAELGFDVLYLPPIHPIGRTGRKGRNNSLAAGPNDPGSPWAIGGPEGGHKSIHPALGSFDDFDRLVAAARELGIEIALDLAFHCSPDHPYVREHPEWFHHRPDGSIKFAENPPKKYEDIYPFDFECERWQELWCELKDIVLFWVRRGVKLFRVDNPHTKPFAFWEWLIAEVRRQYPDVVFLSEAFTRRKVMYYLAKCGFSQSYTYFTWRNTKWELTEYLTELTQTPVREYMRPNFFANTPDILHAYLQQGGRPAFIIRLVLAATLGASYGIYGPAFELCESAAVPGTEEYKDSEKYQLRHWDYDRPGNIRDVVSRVNRIRRDNPALHYNWNLRFIHTDNDQILAYAKLTEDLSNVLLIAVNLDPHHRQASLVHLPLAELGLPQTEPYQVHDLLSDARYTWHGPVNYVELDPSHCPAHIFRLR